MFWSCFLLDLYFLFTIRDNPPVQAFLGENYIEFKEGERIEFDEIKSVDYYESVDIVLNPNGYRWGK